MSVFDLSRFGVVEAAMLVGGLVILVGVALLVAVTRSMRLQRRAERPALQGRRSAPRPRSVRHRPPLVLFESDEATQIIPRVRDYDPAATAVFPRVRDGQRG